MPLPALIIMIAGVLIPLLISIALATWIMQPWKPHRYAAFPPSQQKRRPYHCHKCGHYGYNA